MTTRSKPRSPRSKCAGCPHRRDLLDSCTATRSPALQRLRTAGNGSCRAITRRGVIVSARRRCVPPLYGSKSRGGESRACSSLRAGRALRRRLRRAFGAWAWVPTRARWEQAHPARQLGLSRCGFGAAFRGPLLFGRHPGPGASALSAPSSVLTASLLHGREQLLALSVHVVRRRAFINVMSFWGRPRGSL